MGAVARSASAAPVDAIEDLLLAVHAVATNGLVHGAPPVSVTMWAGIAEIVVQVTDAGPGGLDPLTGYRHPAELGVRGLWSARQHVDDLIIDAPPGGGCRILLMIAAGGRVWHECGLPSVDGSTGMSVGGPTTEQQEGPVGAQPPDGGSVEWSSALCGAASQAVDRAETLGLVAHAIRLRSKNLRTRSRLLADRSRSVRGRRDG
jgi:hypothetical protein